MKVSVESHVNFWFSHGLPNNIDTSYFLNSGLTTEFQRENGNESSHGLVYIVSPLVEWGLRTQLGLQDLQRLSLREFQNEASFHNNSFLNTFCFSYSEFLIEILFLLVGVSLLLVLRCLTLPIESICEEKILAHGFLEV